MKLEKPFKNIFNRSTDTDNVFAIMCNFNDKTLLHMNDSCDNYSAL